MLCRPQHRPTQVAGRREANDAMKPCINDAIDQHSRSSARTEADVDKVHPTIHHGIDRIGYIILLHTLFCRRFDAGNEEFCSRRQSDKLLATIGPRSEDSADMRSMFQLIIDC